MDWENIVAHPLNRTSVIRNTPECSGIYGLRDGARWVYVGESSNLRGALLGYLSGRLPSVLLSEPHLFAFEVCSPRHRVGRHRELVRRYQPICNKKVLAFLAG
jgi:hypothetical protein